MQRQTLLALETATLKASVAVVVRDARGLTVAAEAESDVKNHSDQLITMIDTALREADLELADTDGVAVGAGPGSFTGLRIGMATAKGLCFAAGVPLWTISSLAALARDAEAPAGAQIVAPILDARRGEVFYGIFDVRGPVPRPLVPEDVAGPETAAARIAEARGQDFGSSPILVGDGAALYADAFRSAGALQSSCRQTPSAASVAAIAAEREPAPSLASAAPVYLRPSEAERKYPQGNPGGAFAPRAPE